MKYTVIGAIVGGGIAYYSFLQDLIEIPLALILTVFGLAIGWGMDQPEIKLTPGMREGGRIGGIIVLVIGIIFLLASPLFDYSFQDWWPINDIWNLGIAIPILIGSTFLLLER
jgi:phosphoglycerol transferase MdoB-like AlkP superfamily enzyme